MRIHAWDRRNCGACQRPRVHYRTTGTGGWQCIGTLKKVSDIVVPCGKRRNWRKAMTKEREKG